MNPDKSHQWIAAKDIGFFVGEAFEKPGEWLGRVEEIAGDEVTMAEFVEQLSRSAGIDIRYQKVTWDGYEEAAGEEMTVMLRWFDNAGYDVDIAALRSQYPNLLTWQQYLQELRLGVTQPTNY